MRTIEEVWPRIRDLPGDRSPATAAFIRLRRWEVLAQQASGETLRDDDAIVAYAC